MAQARDSIAEVSRAWVARADAVQLVKAAREGRLLPAAGTGRAVSVEQMELARMRVQMQALRMENEILKKAAAYFAKAAL